MRNIEHHDSDVFILVVRLLALVEELCLHLDETVEGLVGDKGPVPASRYWLVVLTPIHTITLYLTWPLEQDDFC